MSLVQKVGEIYSCDVCGNVVEVIVKGGGELVCCRTEMTLVENPVTGQQNKGG